VDPSVLDGTFEIPNPKLEAKEAITNAIGGCSLAKIQMSGLKTDLEKIQVGHRADALARYQKIYEQLDALQDFLRSHE
jgi:hypothetical protein